MSNPVFMSVVFEGKRQELRSLYGKMNYTAEPTLLCKISNQFPWPEEDTNDILRVNICVF